MRPLKNYLPPVVASLVFLLLLFLTFPFYKYYIDPDAVAYLSIMQRYADGDWHHAVNGLWSPLHPFLAGLFVRGGLQPLIAAHVTNAIAGMGVLHAAFALFKRFGLSLFQLWLTLLMLPFALIYFHYLQLFADAWMLFFLLLYLLVTTRINFTQKKLLWVLAALFAALAFYAKAYAFYFVLLHLTVVCWMSWRMKLVSVKKATFAWLISVLLLVSFVAPWAYLIHKKYDRISVSNAGVLNKTWFLTGQKEYRADIELLVPPPYKGSLTDWEDPWMSKGNPHQSFESSKMFGKQVLLSGRAVIQLFMALNELSPFVLAVLLLSLFSCFRRSTKEPFSYQENILLITAFLFPLGYLTLFIETRYIWLLLYISIIFGFKWLDRAQVYLSPKGSSIAMLIFILCYLIAPVYGMSELLSRQKDIWQEATLLKNKNIRGSFVSNHPDQGREWVLAWLTGNPCYTLRPRHPETNEILAEMQRYGVTYFFDYSANHCGISGLKMIDSSAQLKIYVQQ